MMGQALVAFEREEADLEMGGDGGHGGGEAAGPRRDVGSDGDRPEGVDDANGGHVGYVGIG